MAETTTPTITEVIQYHFDAVTNIVETFYNVCDDKEWLDYSPAEQTALGEFLNHLNDVKEILRTPFDAVVWDEQKNGRLMHVPYVRAPRTESDDSNKKAQPRSAATALAKMQAKRSKR